MQRELHFERANLAKIPENPSTLLQSSSSTEQKLLTPRRGAAIERRSPPQTFWQAVLLSKCENPTEITEQGVA